MGWNIEQERRTKKITNGDDYILLQALNQGDKDDLNDLLMNMDMDGVSKEEMKKESTGKARLMIGSMRHFQRVRSIKDWNLKYTNGKAIPLSEESIRRLPADLISEIDAAIEELNPEPLSPAKKKQ